LPRMLRRLKAEFGNQISIVNLFQYPTVASLSAFMNSKSSVDDSLEKRRELAGKQRALLQRKKRGPHVGRI
jgi:hypothetical protein